VEVWVGVGCHLHGLQNLAAGLILVNAVGLNFTDANIH